MKHGGLWCFLGCFFFFSLSPFSPISSPPRPPRASCAGLRISAPPHPGGSSTALNSAQEGAAGGHGWRCPEGWEMCGAGRVAAPPPRCPHPWGRRGYLAAGGSRAPLPPGPDAAGGARAAGGAELWGGPTAEKPRKGESGVGAAGEQDAESSGGRKLKRRPGAAVHGRGFLEAARWAGISSPILRHRRCKARPCLPAPCSPPPVPASGGRRGARPALSRAAQCRGEGPGPQKADFPL